MIHTLPVPCSLLPGKFYTTKIDVLEGTGHPAKPRQGKRGAPGIPALARVETSLSHLHDGGFGKMLVQTPWKIGSWVMFNLDHNTRLQWKVLCWGGSSMGIPSPGGGLTPGYGGKGAQQGRRAGGMRAGSWDRVAKSLSCRVSSSGTEHRSWEQSTLPRARVPLAPALLAAAPCSDKSTRPRYHFTAHWG